MIFFYLIKTRICDKTTLNEINKKKNIILCNIYIKYAISIKKIYFVKFFLSLTIQKY